MIKGQVEPDIVSCNSLISVWAKHGGAEGAERTVNLTCANKVGPDLVTLGAAAHACARAAPRPFSTRPHRDAGWRPMRSRTMPLSVLKRSRQGRSRAPRCGSAPWPGPLDKP